MGNANINPDIKRDIERLLKNREYRVRYQNVKGFIDNACAKELNGSKGKQKSI